MGKSTFNDTLNYALEERNPYQDCVFTAEKSRGGNEDERDSSTMSICGRSNTTAADFDLGYSDEESDEFGDAVEMLYEKRSSTRESALQKLIRLMTDQYQFEECTFKQETLSRMFLTSYKKGGPLESQLAARALGKCFFPLFV